MAEGRAEGKAEGEARGKAEGKAEAILRILERRGLTATEAQRDQIRLCTDLATLDEWIDRALSVASADALLV